MKPVVLASQSPRRIELLKKIIDQFEVQVSHVEETLDTDDPVTFVREISRRKAAEIAALFDHGIIIGADSIVVSNSRILGKPRNRDEAIEMLTFLSDRTHQVYTGFTIIENPGGKIHTDIEVTDVVFRKLKPWEIERYIDVAQPFDKAGSYGIQDESAVFVEKIDGCFYNVMGLPLTKLYNSLKPFFKL
ncbi:septum formation protein Maf [candidate division KSB1 bacterium]|nr:septum formation protein Maf [candidate division KSB1 bacterium]